MPVLTIRGAPYSYGRCPARLLSLGATIGSVTVLVIGFSNVSLGAALVGETKQVALQQKAPSNVDALKALYRRPLTIPFPKDNPYTPEKAALGKKLYFDTRLVCDVGAILPAVTTRASAGPMVSTSASATE